RRHTRSKRDWSSDVCSSDLLDYREAFLEQLEWVLQLQGDGGIIFRFNGVNKIHHFCIDIAFGHGAIKGGYDVSRGDIGAVGELCALTDRNLVLRVGDFCWLVFSGQSLVYGVVRKVLLI